jgi:sporulation protein YlmC with PRC-barrel domain
MSNHRIKLIALMSAIAGYLASPGLAQSSQTQTADQPSATSSSAPASTPAPDVGATSTSPATTTTSGDRDFRESQSATGRSATGTTQSTEWSASTGAAASGYAAMSMDTVRRASDDEAKDRSFRDFKGKKVRGSDGEDLGKINDFVIDTQSGKIAGVVISTGGILGIGDKLRIVEQSHFQGTATADELSVQIDKAGFEALPVVTERELDSGQFSLSGGTSASVGTQSATASADSPATVSFDADAARTSDQYASSSQFASGSQFARASKLQGKDIHAGEEEVGEIDAIVIDLQQGHAMALVDVEDDFAGTDGKFLVPISKLEINAEDDDRVSTTLSRSDFAMGSSATDETLQPTGRSDTTSDVTSSTYGSTTAGTSASDTSSATYGSTTPGAPDSDPRAAEYGSTTPRATDSDPRSATYGSTTQDMDTERSQSVAGTSTARDEDLSPTGATSADQYPSADSQMLSVSTTIRTELDRDATLSREDVRVTPKDDKIVLEGTVSSDDAKKQIEELAKRNAGETKIENKIKVRNN